MKQWQWQQQQHQLQMQKRSYSVYMSCQSSSSALSLTLQPTKKSSLGSLEKNAGATLADDFSPFIEFLLFAQWHSVQKNPEKVSHLRPCECAGEIDFDIGTNITMCKQLHKRKV